MRQSTSADTESGETVYVTWKKEIKFNLVAGRRRYGAVGTVGTQGRRAEYAYNIVPTGDGVLCHVIDDDGRVADRCEFPTLGKAQEWATRVEAHYQETGRWPGGEM